MRNTPAHLGSLLAVAALILGVAAPAQARKFDGFNDHFNLGRGQLGAVCEANRNFDDPLVVKGARIWTVSCSGWSQRLGRILMFTGPHAKEAADAWRGDLVARSDCDPGGASAESAGGVKTVSCKTRPAGLDYVVIGKDGGGGTIAAEGMNAIRDSLTVGVKYVSGGMPEPSSLASAGGLSSVAGAAARTLDLSDSSGSASLDSRREAAYVTNEQWKFDDAEQVFAELAATSAQPGGSSSVRVEALYNLALNVSNKGRFTEAELYFSQADALVKSGAASDGGLALNYKAAHARNQRHYEDAIKLAQQAISERSRPDAASATVVRDPSGDINIVSAPVGDPSVAQLTDKQRDTLRDVQALQIEATSLEALDREDEARQILGRAISALEQPLSDLRPGQGRTLVLGDAAPWLNTRVRADMLRLDRNIGRAADSLPQLRSAIVAFGVRHPGSLPLAGFLIELARAEAATNDDEGALRDYETAFQFFRDQRGSLGASADLVGTYFDILLRRIGDKPADHAEDVSRFFQAAQTLVYQSSAEAAKRLAARVMSGSSSAAGLARALDETGLQIASAQAQINDLRERGQYQGDLKHQADQQLQTLVDKDKALEASLLQADPKYAASLKTMVELKDLQSTLQPGEVYLKVFLLANRGYGFFVTRDGARPYAIELTRDKAGALVDRLRAPIDKPRLVTVDGQAVTVVGRFNVALAHEAFKDIFGPVQDQVLAAQHLIYEPDVTLIGAPVAAFVTDDASAEVMKKNLEKARSESTALSYAGVSWLGGKLDSSIALSASAFVQVRQAHASGASDPFYGFGDPKIEKSDPRTFSNVKADSALQSADVCVRVRQNMLAGFSEISNTAEEVKTVASSFGEGKASYSLGQAFTDTAIERRGGENGDLNQYRVLYFATHGYLPESNGCTGAALVTSLGNGSESDGLLDVTKIPQLRLDAEMVVLSACNTGRTNGGGAEALGGLVTTFVEAGARNVVVSNWAVETNATEQLMTSMFSTKGVSQAEALAKAERALMNSPDERSHPYYWAAFTIVGDGARRMPG
jgi:hypothetical protein